MMRECEAESFWCQKDPSISKRSHWSRQKITNAPHRSGHFISPVGFVHLLFLSIQLSFHFQFTRPHSFRSAPPQPGSHENIRKRETALSKHKNYFVFCPFLRMKPLTLPASNLCTRRMGCPESISSFHIISLSLGCRLYHPSPPMQKLPCLGFQFLSGWAWN